MAYPYYSSQLLEQDVLCHSNKEERLALTEIFNGKSSSPLTVGKLADEILRAGGNSFANLRRGHGISYSELLYDTAVALKIEEAVPLDIATSSGLSIAEMDERTVKSGTDTAITLKWREEIEKYVRQHESLIAARIIDDAYKKMTPEQRAQVDQKVQELAKKIPGKGLAGLSSSAAVLAVANAGGFATYMLMSTVLSTVSFGLLPFGAYITASSTLSVILGPAGWTLLGAFAAYKLATPNRQKTLKAIVAIVLIRGRKESEEL